jgi:hypothetical protein
MGRNQKGQVSVFLALGFLVLFTMFGMTINVAMVVHDKINVQNAVDFASIYVAQRQAEMLNAIAHTNYQIRQAHKLLAYRYVVLGTAGIYNSQAGQGLSGDERSEDPYARKENFAFCIADEKILLFPRGNNDQFCSEDLVSNGFSGIPPLNVINGSLGGNFGLRAQTIAIGIGIQQGASRAATINWWFVANAMASFKFQIAYRKALIRALAANLVKPIVAGDAGMKDLYGRSVFEGARKTFEYNLSESIRRKGGFNMQVRNSMEGLQSSVWLPEIKTYIMPVYTDYEPGSQNGEFTPLQVFYNILPKAYRENYQGTTTAQIDREILNVVDSESIIRDLRFVMPMDTDFEEILGFEKNPWYMVYNQVQAQVSTGALFSPLPNISLNAQAFAKPFGGRIGPWYGKDWQSGSPTSTGDENVPLWPLRKLNSNPPTTTDRRYLPNAPKYPGDDGHGFRSRLAQTSTGLLGTGTRDPAGKFSVDDYKNITYSLAPGGTYNGLAVNSNATPARMRDRELAIVAPDLFDITYYSIEPNFHENYLVGKLDEWLMNEVRFTSPISYDAPIWRDLGYETTSAQSFAVKNQLQSSVHDANSGRVFYFLQNGAAGLANLLTSWVGGTEVTDYRSPASGDVRNRFGRCRTPYTSSGKPNIPGECLSDGGRTGYSVKIVSKEYLKSNQHRMSQNSTGPILNPPLEN